MKLFLTILLLPLLANSQSYTASWTGSGHGSYLVQQGRDSVTWTTIGTVSGQLSSSSYQFTIPGPTYYYRVVADKDSTKAILVTDVLSIKNPPPQHGKTKTAIQTLSVKVSVDSRRIHYMIESQRDQLMTYSLYDIQGRKLTEKLVPLHYGQNDFFDNRPEVRGVYFGQFQGYFDFKPVEIIIP